MTQPGSPHFDPEWLEPGRTIPVDVRTTAALLTEVKRLLDELDYLKENVESRGETIVEQDEEIDILRRENEQLRFVIEMIKDALSDVPPEKEGQ